VLTQVRESSNERTLSMRPATAALRMMDEEGGFKGRWGFA
jgi:ribosomal protein L28